jgi:hypothetical protein
MTKVYSRYRAIGFMATRVLGAAPLAAILLAPLASRVSLADSESPIPWFQPALAVNNDTMCDGILAGARRHSAEYDGLKPVSSFYSGNDQERGNSTIHDVPDHPDYLAFDQRDGKPLYVKQLTNPGCGGACETESLGLQANAPETGGDDSIPTPASESWLIYESPSSGRQFVVGVVDRELEVYRPSTDAQWQLACRIQLEPDSRQSADPHVSKAQASLQALRVAVEDMARGEGTGMCGTMHTDRRWSEDFEHALNQVLFDPASTAVAHPYPSENSYGDYPRIYAALQEWSLGGVFEYDALQQYDAQLRRSIAVVKEFYRYGFHWSDAQASEMAQASITNAVGHRFGFYMYTPYPISGERELRRALLTHQPMTDVRAAGDDIKIPELSGPGHDNILNVAIDYPEAISYLLSKGADPNGSNEFGKTPLMYAAQYNQLQALLLLLKAGADPNATTNTPPEDCTYALRTHKATVLHYAVR